MLCRPRVVTLVIALLLLAACGFAQNEGGLNNFDFSLARGTGPCVVDKDFHADGGGLSFLPFVYPRDGSCTHPAAPE
jgi:hypothetical protein